MLSYCPCCDSYFEGHLKNETYDDTRICDVCTEHLHSRCQQCDLLYPNYNPDADQELCPECLPQLEGDEDNE